MEKKQTAVDWLEKRINSSRDLTGEIRKLLLQAKQMEIIQIENAYDKGIEHQLDRYASTNSAKYYQETYGKEPKEIWIAISQSPITGALKATPIEEVEGEFKGIMKKFVDEFKKDGIAEVGGLPVIKIIKTEI